MKFCSKCHIEKELSDFARDKHTNSGFTSQCKKCRSDFNNNSENSKRLHRKYRINNRDHIKSQSKEYYQRTRVLKLQQNKEWSLQNKEKHKALIRKWSLNNVERISILTKRYRVRINKRVNDREKNDPVFKLRRRLGYRTYSAFKHFGWRKSGKTEGLLGCTYNEAKLFIEGQFKNGMNWGNHGEWQIDHKKPLASAKTEQELIQLCHYKNLQPLWRRENIIKSNKILSADMNGIEMNEEELDELNENKGFVYQKLIDKLF